MKPILIFSILFALVLDNATVHAVGSSEDANTGNEIDNGENDLIYNDLEALLAKFCESEIFIGDGSNENASARKSVRDLSRRQSNMMELDLEQLAPRSLLGYGLSLACVGLGKIQEEEAAKEERKRQRRHHWPYYFSQ